MPPLLEERFQILEELQKILHSEPLRHSEQHRLLLSFMVHKSIEQRGDELKEYSVGVDALNKPESYNPRRDATVRIQVGRLRTRLDEYYRTEGAHDPIIFNLPKGGFRIFFQNRGEPASANLSTATRAVLPIHRRPPWVLWMCLGLSMTLTIVLGWMARSATARADRIARLSESLWTPELEAIWTNFIDDKRPLLLSLGTPLFVSVNGSVIRDSNWNLWQDDKLSPRLDQIRSALKATSVKPTYDYNGFGETVGALRLYRLLISRGKDLLFRRGNSLSWDDLKERDIILLGSPKSVDHLKSFRDLRMKLAFDIEESRIVNFDPASGESQFYAMGETNKDALYTGYALVTRLPGVDGTGNIMILGSPNTEGTLAACEYVTSAQGARELTREFSPGQPMPRAYQALLKVTFKAGVPLTVSCIAHRTLSTNLPVMRP